jgi:hypothetical protein
VLLLGPPPPAALKWFAGAVNVSTVAGSTHVDVLGLDVVAVVGFFHALSSLDAIDVVVGSALVPVFCFGS